MRDITNFVPSGFRSAYDGCRWLGFADLASGVFRVVARGPLVKIAAGFFEGDCDPVLGHLHAGVASGFGAEAVVVDAVEQHDG